MDIREGIDKTIEDYFTMLISDARTPYKNLNGFDRSTVDYYITEFKDVLSKQGVVKKVEGELPKLNCDYWLTNEQIEKNCPVLKAGYTLMEEL